MTFPILCFDFHIVTPYDVWLSGRGVWTTKHFFAISTFSNGCILVKTSPINTKFGDFVNLGVQLFLTMWVNSY